MKWLTLLVLTATTVAALHPTYSVIAAEKKTTTVVTISGLHCAVCAKKVAKKLELVTHVASVNVDVKSSEASVTPAKDKHPSPKALWEAVEAAGYKPTKLVGPAGEFKKKPAA